MYSSQGHFSWLIAHDGSLEDNMWRRGVMRRGLGRRVVLCIYGE